MLGQHYSGFLHPGASKNVMEIKAKVASCIRKIGRQGGGDIEPNPFLSLIHPDLTQEVLKFLDQKSLLALRSVCTQTKTWIDSSNHFTRIQIILNGRNLRKKIRKIAKSKTNFCNFVIGGEALQNSEFLRDFTEKLGARVRILEISAFIGGRALIQLLSECVFIKSLTLFGINFERKPRSRSIGAAEITQSVELQQKLAKNLQNLKYLRIEKILFKEEPELINLKLFLSRCTSLEILKLPMINFDALKFTKVERNRIVQMYVLKPLVKYLRRRHRSGGPNLKCLILEMCNPFQSKVFIDLTVECFKGQTIIKNMHQGFLHNLDYSQGRILETIGTLAGLNESIFLSKLNNLECLSVWISSADLLSQRNLDNAWLPALTCLNLYLDSTEGDPHRTKAFLDALVRTERKSVLSLTVSSMSNDIFSARLVTPLDIAENFQFLKKLSLYQWDATDREFLELWGGLGMHRVEDLSMLLCPNLTDRGLIGGDLNNPAILKLTDLKHLQITSLYGSITNVTLELAIRHMKLKSFRLSSHGVTLAGYKFLLDPPFRTTIKFLHCTKPFDCKHSEFVEFLKEIENRKYQEELQSGNPWIGKQGTVGKIKCWLTK